MILRGLRGSVRRKHLLLRFLLSKWMYEGLSKQEVENIYHLVNYFQDGRFEILNSYSCRILQEEVLRKLNVSQKMFGRIYLSQPVVNLILSKHSYFGIKNQQIGKDFLSTRISYVILEKLRFPEKPYIGVGYKDKGKASKEDKEWLHANAKFHQNQALIVRQTDFDLLYYEIHFLELNQRMLEQGRVCLEKF